jgi:quercetin dioxygenase-like cupin family protein
MLSNAADNREIYAMADQTTGQALRPSRGGFALIGINEEISRLQAKLDSSNADREAVSLVKDYGLNLMLMLLKAGAHLHEHRAKGPIAIQVISGRVRITAASAAHELAAGAILALDRDIAHSVEALESSALLLTVAMG